MNSGSEINILHVCTFGVVIYIATWCLECLLVIMEYVVTVMYLGIIKQYIYRGIHGHLNIYIITGS